MTAAATIEVDEFLPHPVSVVWEALTDSDQLTSWLMPNDFVPEVGHRFTLDTGNWGTTKCEVLEIQPQRLLRYSWNNGPLDTEVIWRLVPEGHGTRLFLEHRGFDLDQPVQRFAYDGMRGGWRSCVLTALGDHLAAAHEPPEWRPRVGDGGILPLVGADRVAVAPCDADAAVGSIGRETAMGERSDGTLRAHLDELAHWVAARLDMGDVTAAWAVTVALEHGAGITPALEVDGPGPVIGRCFARAHCLLLTGTADDHAVRAALTVTVDPGSPEPALPADTRTLGSRLPRRLRRAG